MAEKRQQTIEELKKKHADLHEKKITAQANLRTARDELLNLKKTAKDQFGTEDLDDLRAKLKEMNEENERKRAAYQTHLEKIETDLKAVDAKFAQASEQR